MMASERRRPDSIRLKGYDYTLANAYFITICAQDRAHTFGAVLDGVVHLNQAGETIQEAWEALPVHYPGVLLDAFVIMPDHVHGIIVMAGQNEIGHEASGFERAGLKPAPTRSEPNENPPSVRHGLSEIIRAFKTFSARKINAQRQTPGIPVWQRNYWERVIREDEMERIRQYIVDNPARWNTDPPHVSDGNDAMQGLFTSDTPESALYTQIV